MTSKLIIIRGNSGSGKTTLAKEIHRRLPRNTLLIPQDTAGGFHGLSIELPNVKACYQL